MRQQARWALALALAVFAAPPAPAQAQERTLALVGGMLLDGHDGPPLHHASVVIENEKIVAVGPMSEVKVPEGATVVDTRGRVMLPGLIDLHVHLIILGHGDYSRWDPWIAQNELVEKVMEISAKQLLMAGITSAVDLGGTLKESLSVRDRINRGEIPGPRMWMAGPWITRDPGDYSDALPTQILVDTPGEAARRSTGLGAARLGGPVAVGLRPVREAPRDRLGGRAVRRGLRRSHARGRRRPCLERARPRRVAAHLRR